MRLDKFISTCLVISRQDAKKLIKLGKIKINHEIITKDDYKVNELSDIVIYNNEIVKYEKYIYLMMNKPSGYVTSTKDLDKTVMELLPQQYRNLFPVGRLDKDTVGLLLFTNNGMLSHNLTSPKKDVNKTYYVELLNPIEDIYIKLFNEGVVLDDNYKTKPATLKIINVNSCYLTISEGKFHQVKRMFLSVGNTVTHLKRVSFGPLILDETLLTGKYRTLTEEEIKSLLQYM